MLYNLEGIITELTGELAVIDCNGIGFGVSITPGTASALTVGEKRKLYIIEAIGENNYDLFGFLTKQEKRYFSLLTSVSGVGPKAAMAILSYNTPDVLATAIVNGNESALTACPGIGKKTAQRVILELKDKIAKDTFASPKDMPVSMPVKGGSSAYDQAVTALSVLGYNTADIVPILRQINTEGMKTDEIIKTVLKYMV